MWNRGGTESVLPTITLGVAVFGSAFGLSAAAATGTQGAPEPNAVTVVEHIGAELPRDLEFTNDRGDTVSLGSLLDGTPLVLSFAYFSCPMLCPVGQAAMADALRDSGWTLGRDVRAMTISIDPRDGPAVAREWRGRAAAQLGHRTEGVDWHFLVSRSDAARRLADRVGFQYAYDPTTAQYSHPSALIVVGRDGRVSQYLYGISYSGADLARALSAARDNRRIGSVAAFVLRCFHYVPAARAHGSAVVWMLRTCGLLVSAAIGTTLYVLWRAERV